MVFEVAAQSFVSTAAEAMPNAAARSVPVSLIERCIDSPRVILWACGASLPFPGPSLRVGSGREGRVPPGSGAWNADETLAAQ